jgi:hypothetical protein
MGEAKARSSNWGGRRSGSGRRVLPGGGEVTACFTLTPALMALVAAWQQKHGCPNASAAVREMLQAAALGMEPAALVGDQPL